MAAEQSDLVLLAEKGKDNSQENKDRFNLPDLFKANAVASAHSHNDHASIPSLPDLDLHSPPERDEGEHSVAEELIDDLFTIIKNNGDGKVTVKENQPAELDSSAGDLPVIYTPDVEPGKIGIIMSKNKDGHTYYTPFVAGDPNILAPRTGPSGVVMNESAAKELKIDEDLKKGEFPSVDIIAVPYNDAGVVFPKNKDDLHSLVKQKLRDMAQDILDKQAEEWAKIEATLPDPPKPDKDFGYIRTTRSADELRTIADNYRQIARESHEAWQPNGIADRMKEFGKQAQKDIDKYKDEINKKSDALKLLELEENLLTRRAEKSADNIQEAALLKERARKAAESATAVGNALEVAKYNLSYAQIQLKISKDTALFTRHMQAKASAAAILAYNPDMEGSLNGRRVVINSGHWPGDPKFPGFSKDDTAEWKLNFESHEVAANMIRMAGGAVKVVNQIDLPKDDRGMTGLANAIKAAKPEVAISIHHDSSDPPDSDAMKGTLTLQCAKTSGAESLEYAKAIHMAKVNYAGIDDKYNKNGISVGIREQCGRGIQGHNVGAPFILDEQLSTHKDYWPQARDPKVVARLQFAKVVSIYEYLEGKPRYKSSPDVAKEWRDVIWSKTDLDDVFKNRPKVGAW